MSEILINTTTAGIQHQPSIAAIRNSHVLVAWVDRSDLTIKGRLLQADGDPSGPEFVINTPTVSGSNIDRQRSAIASSGPVVAWIEQAVNPPGPRPHVKVRRFSAEGEPSGLEITVSATDVDPTSSPAVTGMIDGGFLVTWADARPDRRIRAQRFGFDGARRGDEFQVNAGEGFHLDPVATRLVNGNVVIAWRSDPAPPGGGALTFRIFDLEGNAVADETVPNLSGFTGQKAMTLLDDGNFVIAHVRSQGASDLGVAQGAVEANVFLPDGASANIPILRHRRGDLQSLDAGAGAAAGRTVPAGLGGEAGGHLRDDAERQGPRVLGEPRRTARCRGRGQHHHHWHSIRGVRGDAVRCRRRRSGVHRLDRRQRDRGRHLRFRGARTAVDGRRIWRLGVTTVGGSGYGLFRTALSFSMMLSVDGTPPG